MMPATLIKSDGLAINPCVGGRNEIGKIPETRFCASRVRRARMIGGSRFSIRRRQRAFRRVLNGFYRVSFWNQATAGNPLFESAEKSAMNGHTALAEAQTNILALVQAVKDAAKTHRDAVGILISELSQRRAELAYLTSQISNGRNNHTGG